MLEGWAILCTVVLIFTIWFCLKYARKCNHRNVVITPVDVPHLVVAPPPYPYQEVLEEITTLPSYAESQEGELV
jgi:hypothetical protein